MFCDALSMEVLKAEQQFSKNWRSVVCLIRRMQIGNCCKEFPLQKTHLRARPFAGLADSVQQCSISPWRTQHVSEHCLLPNTLNANQGHLLPQIPKGRISEGSCVACLYRQVQWRFQAASHKVPIYSDGCPPPCKQKVAQKLAECLPTMLPCKQ